MFNSDLIEQDGDDGAWDGDGRGLREANVGNEVKRRKDAAPAVGGG
jgi:hypothetical protein